MFLIFWTRGSDKMAEFHLRTPDIIPFNGVAGAVKGAVGNSLPCILDNTPALTVALRASEMILGNLNGSLAKLIVLLMSSSM
jgi:hypothetical protein